MLAGAARWLAVADAYVAPATDFFGYQRTAQSILRLRLPERRPRGCPGLPLAMALVQRAVPGSSPFLHAGRLVSLAAWLSLFISLFSIGRRWLGPSGGLILVWLVTSNAELVGASLQPVTDSLFLALTVGAVWSATRESGWAYVMAGMAALVRYEGVFLVVGLLVADMIYGPRKPTRLLWGVAALAPILLWRIALAMCYGTPALPGVQGTLRMGSVGLGFVKVFMATELTFFPRSFGVAAKEGSILAASVAAIVFCALSVLAVLGIRRIKQRDARAVLLLFAFAVPFVVLHMWVGWATQRYSLPVLWIFQLLLIAGLQQIARVWQAKAGCIAAGWAYRAVVGAGAVAIGAAWAVWSPVKESWLWGGLMSFPVLAYVLWTDRVTGTNVNERRGLRWGPVAALAVVFVGVGSYDYASYRIYYDASKYAELVPFVRWYRSDAPPTCRVICHDEAFNLLTLHFGLEGSRLVNVASLSAESLGELTRAGHTALLLWNETSFDMRGLDDYRERVERSFGSSARLIAQVHNGMRGWQVARRFEHRGRHGVLYAPSVLPRQADAGQPT